MAMSVVYSNAFGRVIAENRGGVVSRYVTDTQGSTIGLVSSSGVLTDRWVYWPYGEVAQRTGTNVTPLTWLGTLGYYLDQVSKLFYVRARHLRADLARWLTADPLWPVEQPYHYVSNSPALLRDPFGLAPGGPKPAPIPCPNCPCPPPAPDQVGTTVCCGTGAGQCAICIYWPAGTNSRVVQCTAVHETTHCQQLTSGSCNAKCPLTNGCGQVLGNTNCGECQAYSAELNCLMAWPPACLTATDNSLECQTAQNVCRTLLGCGEQGGLSCSLSPAQAAYCASIGAKC